MFVTLGFVWTIISALPLSGAIAFVAEADSHEPAQDASACPTTLQDVLPEMASHLALLTDRKFKRTMRESLAASIPEAIGRAGDLRAHMDALAQDIRDGERRLHYVEAVARAASENFLEPLTPCRRGDKGSYCRAVEEYHTLRALLLAQRAFVDALACYRERAVE